MPNEPYRNTTEPLHRSIRMTRRAKEISQLEVAVHVGISQSQFSLFEQGHVKLPADVVGVIQQFLGDAQQREHRHA